jgi:hypothetical protein
MEIQLHVSVPLTLHIRGMKKQITANLAISLVLRVLLKISHVSHVRLVTVVTSNRSMLISALVIALVDTLEAVRHVL